MKSVYLLIVLLAFCCGISFASEKITIETETCSFFENIVSDTLLLLDPNLKSIIADDLDTVVKNSVFQLQVNSWKPRPNPKIRLSAIYDKFNSNNAKESLASLIQPVVEIACSSPKHDPFNEYQSKCIKEMFGYPIIQPIEIVYTYGSGKTKEQFIADLTGLNNGNRYQQMVRTIADIMNSAYEKSIKSKIAKDVYVVKNPLKLVQSMNTLPSKLKSSVSGKSGSSCEVVDVSLYNETTGGQLVGGMISGGFVTGGTIVGQSTYPCARVSIKNVSEHSVLSGIITAKFMSGKTKEKKFSASRISEGEIYTTNICWNKNLELDYMMCEF